MIEIKAKDLVKLESPITGINWREPVSSIYGMQKCDGRYLIPHEYCVAGRTVFFVLTITNNTVVDIEMLCEGHAVLDQQTCVGYMIDQSGLISLV